MANRSPILGYNHNVRHRGLVFHVQTEDSGIANPHIFTHLFHGGVIVNTRKLVYDAGADEEVVKALMQAQHKAMLKDLKSGRFSDKIELYFGEHPDLEHFDPGKAAKQRERTAPFQPIDVAELAEVGTAPTMQLPRPPSEVSAAFDAVQMPVDDDITTPVQQPPPATRPPSRVTAPARRPVPPEPPEGAYAQHRRSSGVHGTVGATPPPPPPPRKGRAPGKSGGVVVSRPAVIVGAPPRVVGDAGRAQSGSHKAPRVRKATEKSAENLFGQGLISEKSLDEVILAYLSDDSSEE